MSVSKSSVFKAITLTAVVAGVAAAVSGCAVTVPRGIEPVTGFDAKRYMGTWYELARIDHRFEKGLSRTTAHYSLEKDGTVTVINRGYSEERNEWKESEGKARFLGEPDIAALKVSFFGPFYGGYNVVSLDDEYQTSLVIGNSLDYFWLLSRSKSIPDRKFRQLLQIAQELGVDMNQVIAVAQ
ncbi:lipocalin family protein [Comamonas sp. Y33R10-2]|nr:lipocalin family protein [Comamonas sp. Y33R10-2]QXZ10661.1 lipocalin family protein [Comamonas sp. Y33R10-2]